MMRKIILVLISVLFFAGSVSAWNVHSDRYTGTIDFLNDGKGVATIDGYPTTTFTWNDLGNNQYEAHYWFYTVPFTYDPTNDTITSVNFPDAYMSRS